MTDVAIRIENLSKAYRIGLKEEIPDSLFGAAAAIAKAPLQNFRRLSQLNTFDNNGESDDLMWALKDVSFDVKEGEVVGVIGRNGAGKSTLLKILSRITEPTSGRALIHGRVSSLLEVGTGFHPEMTGRDNVYMNGTILGMRKREIDRKFDEIVAFSGVEKFLDTPVKRYSSGMKVRLAFAVAAHLEPEILIIDEVLAVGDAEFQRKCLGKMQDVASGGRTVLFVSHNLAAVEALCTQGVCLESGQLTFDGNQSDAIRFYTERTSATVSQGEYRRGVASDSVGDVYVKSARLLSQGRFNTEGYRSGEPLEFVVECYAGREVTGPALGIGIDGSHQQRITTFHTSHDRGRQAFSKVRGAFTFVCRIDDLALSPGEYRVKLNLEGEGHPLDVLDPAFSFLIEPSSRFGNVGRTGRGLVCCMQDWSLSS